MDANVMYFSTMYITLRNIIPTALRNEKKLTEKMPLYIKGTFVASSKI